ncbi:polysaccharide biosynthesis/export family protein [Mucilaginibacter sp. X5P1]|uniref:polysaccharide biosynthesis/export family protein n=1 Tax=Mucilaginibacter sp. X5P1 TaxID=2723088 RepID=UPI00161F70CA|nr:polysaccharide biosynthesis/export family protein [Mucilaginibacter sp. X5P1]MBB6136831.1 polysaccharide export outer membrane protein [Mucilaginibacter sp. X5P1]
MSRRVLNHHLQFVLSISSILLLFSSCSYKQDQVLFEGNTQTTASISPATIYRIKPQDILQVRNLQNVKYIVDDAPSNSSSSPSAANADNQTYQVEEDSTVGLPVLGNVKIAGLTRYEAEKKIAYLYGKTLLKDPVIQVKILNLKVTLMGEVKTPGNYPLLKDKTTLTEVLGEAGGLTSKADEKNIKIIRGPQENPQVTEIDLGKLNSLSNPACILQNQDIIYVSESRHAVKNEKLQNLSNIAQPALTLLNTVLIIFTLSK